MTTDDGLLVVAAVRDATVRQGKEDQLVEANRQKSRFLAAASHDLRQPLQTLNLLNRAARKQAGTDASMLTLVERQQLALDSMSALLASVLDISKLDSGGVTASPAACAIEDILDRVRSDFEPQAVDRGLTLVVEPSREGGYTDPELMRRLLGNLVSNAIRYTQRGEVRISCVGRGERISIEVRDTGIGIPPNEIERVFEEFYQVDRGTQRPEGLGLGLSIVRRLQQLLGCGIELESVLGAGTTFRITIPRVELTQLSADEPAGETATPGGHILVIDDERPVAEATCLLLELEGFKASVASSQQEALDCLRAQTPDLIVSDFHLRGGENGADVVAAVRKHHGKTVPVIFVTGDTARSALAGSRVENALLLNKPVRADDLLLAVRERISS